jgi:hypothetical protein
VAAKTAGRQSVSACWQVVPGGKQTEIAPKFCLSC